MTESVATEAIFAIGRSQAGRSTFIAQILSPSEVESPALGDGSGKSVTRDFILWPTRVGTVVDCPGIDNTEVHISPEEFGHMVSVVVATANVKALKFMIFESLTSDSLQLRGTAAFLAMALGKQALKSAIVVASKVCLCPASSKRIGLIRQVISEIGLAELFLWRDIAVMCADELDMLHAALDRVGALPITEITYLLEQKRCRAKEMHCQMSSSKFHVELEVIQHDQALHPESGRESVQQNRRTKRCKVSQIDDATHGITDAAKCQEVTSQQSPWQQKSLSGAECQDGKVYTKKIWKTFEHPFPVHYYYQASLKAINEEVHAYFRQCIVRAASDFKDPIMNHAAKHQDECRRVTILPPEDCTIDVCADDSLIHDHLERHVEFSIPKVDLQQVCIKKVMREYVMILPEISMIYKPGVARVAKTWYDHWPDSSDLSITMLPQINQVKLSFGDGLWDFIPESITVDGNVLGLRFRKLLLIETYHPPNLQPMQEDCWASHSHSTMSSAWLWCPSEISSCGKQVLNDKFTHDTAALRPKSEPCVPISYDRIVNTKERDACSTASAPARSTWPHCFTPDTLFYLVLPQGDTTLIKARDVQVGQKLNSPNSEGYAIVKSVRSHKLCERDLVRIQCSNGSVLEISADHRLALRVVGELDSRDIHTTANDCLKLCSQDLHLYLLQDNAEMQKIVTVTVCPRTPTSLVEISFLEDRGVYAVTRPVMFAMLGSESQKSVEIPEGYAAVRMKDNKGDEDVNDVVKLAFEHLRLPSESIIHVPSQTQPEKHLSHIVFIPEALVQQVQQVIHEAMKQTRSALSRGRGGRAPRIVFDFHDESRFHPLRSSSEVH